MGNSTSIPNNWCVDPFTQLIERCSNRNKVQKTFYKDKGMFPIVDQGQKFIAGYTDDSSQLYSEKLPVIIFGDHTRIIKYVDFQFATGADGVQLIRPKDSKLDSKFFYYVLCNIPIRNEGYARHYKLLKETNIVYPSSLEEQKKIAAILSSVDDAIQATQTVIDQTRRVKQGLLQQLLTRGIGHTRFKQTEIGEIPEDWDVVHLSEIASHERSSFANGPFGSNLLKNDLRTTGVPVIYIRDIKNAIYNPVKHVYVDKNKADELSSCEVLPGDILITKVGDPPGIASIYPEGCERAIVTQDVIRLRTNSEKCQPEFVRIVINSPLGCTLIENISIEGTRKRMALGTFKKIPFPLPTMPEQEQITKAITLTENTIIEEQQKLESLNRTKRGLMQDLLTGRVRVKLDEEVTI